jgi:hypothetical protein
MNYPYPAPKDDPATRITLLAVGSRDAALLELMLQRFLRNEFVIVPAATAEMAIVDGDSSGGPQALAEWQARCPAAPTVVLSLQAQENSENVIYIRKPINIHTLIDMLSELRPYARNRVPAVDAERSCAMSAAPADAKPRNLPHAATEGPIVVGDEGSNDVVSVEICMSNDLDEIFSASDVRGPGFSPASLPANVPQSGASASAPAGSSSLFRNILARLDGAAHRAA